MLDIKDIQIIDCIFRQRVTKNDLSQALNCSIKTIELRTKKYTSIYYKKKLGCYIFNGLLPTQITSNVILDLILEEIQSNTSKKFYFNFLTANYGDKPTLITTSTLPLFVIKLIQLQHAINHCIKIKIEYKNKKYCILPKQIRYTNNTRLLLADCEEKKIIFDISFLAILSIKEYAECQNNTIQFNYFGLLENKKSVVIRLKNKLARYFIREVPRDFFYEFLYEDDYGIFIKFYYTDEELYKFYKLFNNDIEITDKIVEEKIKNFNPCLVNKDRL